jgi:ABC-2 type transport system ATP-binding protein
MTSPGTNAPSHTAPAISAHGLRVAFGEHTVLDGIDLQVSSGSVFALLGPNGAGKTTMVHVLSTLLRPDSGTAHVHGHDVVAEADMVRGVIGLTGQFAAVDGLLTGAENLQLMADLHHLGRAEGRRRVTELLERFDLVDAGSTMASSYSGGMRRRLDLAMTLVGDPRIIFLDEPTTGLDPRSRRTMWQIIRELVADGVTIFLTTQYLEEADQLADRIAILDRGRLIAQGTPTELKRQVPGGSIRLEFSDAAALDAAQRRFAEADTSGRLGRSTVDADTLTLEVDSDGGLDSLRAVIDELDRAAIDVRELSIHTPDLDDVFFALTGRADSATGSRSDLSTRIDNEEVTTS